VGKLVAAFVFFLAASAVAIREAKPPAPRVDPDVTAPAHVTAPADEAPPSRAIRDEVPPWVKYAAPPAPPPSPPPIERPITRVITIEPTTIEIVDPSDIPDVIDKCPAEPADDADDDGCPEPYNGPKERVILID